VIWELTLLEKSGDAPAAYHLKVSYRPAGTRGKSEVRKHEGKWTTSKGTRSNPDAVVYELDGAVRLCEIDRNVLQLLNADRSLMVGDGGWSHTLYRSEAAEKLGVLVPPTAPEMSYSIAPVSTGPGVFGVFEGRTPYFGISDLLGRPRPKYGIKAKWRVTLYQNEKTREPTRYKIEGSLFQSGAREGTWTIEQGGSGKPRIFHLSAVGNDAELKLLEGDENVLFFLDQHGKPMVGHIDFGYTLNRRSAQAEVSVAPAK
jgi:hypothetical protein